MQIGQKSINNMSAISKKTSWVVAIIAAIIMVQTLCFKFYGTSESIYIFTKIGLEPIGRFGTGIAELFASILIIIPAKRWLGALLGFGLMSGALFFHFTTLGVQVMDDGGLLFGLAIVALSCCGLCIWLEKEKIINEIVALKKNKQL
jgi:putative oxidoreductase